MEVNEENISGFTQLNAGIVPRNLNPKMWTQRANDGLGGLHVYPYLKAADGQELTNPGLLDLHPNKLWPSMEANVDQDALNSEGTKKFILVNLYTEAQWPLQLNKYDEEGNLNPRYFLNFWTEILKGELAGELIIEYAPNYPDASTGTPPWNKTTGYDSLSIDEAAWTAANWTTTRNFATSKWERRKYGIGKFTRPIPIGNLENSFLDVRFKRGADTILEEIIERYKSNGDPNNAPDDWEDVPPSPNGQGLFYIEQLKDNYGNGVSEWFGPVKIIETPTLTRYSKFGTPDPNLITDALDPYNSGTEDTNLTASGWLSNYTNDLEYVATRTGVSYPYTAWVVRKIKNEGISIERKYKLLSAYADYDDSAWIAANKPNGNDPTNEGWSATLLVETGLLVNYVSEVKRGTDGKIIGDWSNPVPFTAFPTVIDAIEYTDNSFVRKKDGSILPASIVLNFAVKKQNDVSGNLQDLEDFEGITLTSVVWTKVINNGVEVDLPAGTTKEITVVPADVTGNALYHVIAIYDVYGTAVTYEETIQIADISDGLDAPLLILNSNAQFFTEVTGTPNVFTPSSIKLSAYKANLGGASSLKLYILTVGADPSLVGSWTEITTTPANGVVKVGDDVIISGGDVGVTATTIFAAANERLFRVTNGATAVEVGALKDDYTIYRLLGTNIGTNGEDALTLILTNETDIVATNPVSNVAWWEEAEPNYVRPSTRVYLFNGGTLIPYASWTSVNITDTNIGDSNDVSSADYLTVEAGTLGAVNNNGSHTIAVVYSGKTITKTFKINKVIDSPGAVIGDIDLDEASPNASLFFKTGVQEGNIILKAKLYIDGVQQVSGLTYAWEKESNVTWKETPTLTGSTLTIQRGNVFNFITVYCNITYAGIVYRTPPITINDFSDSKNYILYKALTTNSATPSRTSPTTTGVNTGWYAISANSLDGNADSFNPDLHDLWMIQGQESGTKGATNFEIVWTTPNLIFRKAKAGYRPIQLFGSDNTLSPTPVTPTNIEGNTNTNTREASNIKSISFPEGFWKFSPDPTKAHIWVIYALYDPDTNLIVGSWSTVAKWNGDTGGDGIDGDTYFTKVVYRKATATPDLPVLTTVAQPFTIDPADWTRDKTSLHPVDGAKKIYQSVATYKLNNGSDPITWDRIDNWSAPALIDEGYNQVKSLTGYEIISNVNELAKLNLKNGDLIICLSSYTGTKSTPFTLNNFYNVVGDVYQILQYDIIQKTTENVLTKIGSLKGIDGTNGTNGITIGITRYFNVTGGVEPSSGTGADMNNFTQGVQIDTLDTTTKKLRIHGWVTVYMENYWVTLKLSSSTSSIPSGNGANLISQRNYHVQDPSGVVMQHHIDAIVSTNNRYIGLSFSDGLFGGNSSGQVVGDYGLEIYIID